jgi:hypothetical protein
MVPTGPPELGLVVMAGEPGLDNHRLGAVGPI